MFCITQGLAYLDKTSLNYGNLFGMRADLNVTTAQFVRSRARAEAVPGLIVHRVGLPVCFTSVT